MLTTILSAACALALSAATVQVDTLQVYVINGERVENFDGSQLVGKTISVYRTMTARETGNGLAPVTKIHVINTDGYTGGYQVVNDSSSSKMAVTGADNERNLTIVASSQDGAVIEAKNNAEVFINGKKSSQKELAKIKPHKIANITVYRAGSEEAAAYTDNKDMGVILVTLK